MACEITVKLKDSLKSITKKTTVYEPITADVTDPKIDALIADAEKNFGGEYTKCQVTIKIIGDK